MKYLFNHSEVSPLSAELILIPCYQRSNQGDENFHQKSMMKCQSNWRRLTISCSWGQEFFSPKL